MSSKKMPRWLRHGPQLLLGAACVCSGAPAHGALSAGQFDSALYSGWLEGGPECVDGGADGVGGPSSQPEVPSAVARLLAAGAADAAPKAQPTSLAPAQKRLKGGKPPPAAAVTAAPVPALAAAPKWEMRPADRTLNVAMARWAAQAGWQLLWEIPVDYAVEAETSLGGTFEQAVEAVTKSMESAEIPLKAIFYTGNRVIRIVAKGAE